MKLLASLVVIPFATGAGLSAIFLFTIYYLDVGSIRSSLAASSGDIFDLGLVPFTTAFGALAVGTNQAIMFLTEI